MKNRQPFAASIFRAVKEKKAASAKKYSGFGEKHAPSSKRGKKYNRCMRENEKQKRATCFAKLLQNKLNSDDQLVAGCEKLLQIVESSSTSCNKI